MAIRLMRSRHRHGHTRLCRSTTPFGVGSGALAAACFSRGFDRPFVGSLGNTPIGEIFPLEAPPAAVAAGMGCDQVDHTMAAHNEYQEREYDEKYQGSGLHGRCPALLARLIWSSTVPTITATCCSISPLACQCHCPARRARERDPTAGAGNGHLSMPRMGTDHAAEVGDSRRNDGR